jgi:hypothetical protein
MKNIFTKEISTSENSILENGNIDDEVSYMFKTAHGKMIVKPSDIIEALKEQSEHADDIDLKPPEEDLQGWGIINATDENGNSRPLFLMRVLPNMYHPSHDIFKEDDEIMCNLVMRNIYKLTPAKIKWLQFKMRFRRWIKNIFNIRIKIEIKKGSKV